MTPREQLRVAFWAAPRAVTRLSPRGRRLALAYLALGTALLGALAAALLALEGPARRVLLSWLFPTELHAPADFFVAYVFASQTRQVLANALVGLTLALVGLLLFRVKERLSQAVERDADLLGGRPFRELPWWLEAFEEVKLALLYVAAFVVIFWLGHDPAPWRKVLATVASYLFLFFSVAVDFGAPLLMRHGLRYTQIIKAVFARPLASFGFGLVFAAPTVVATQLVAHTSNLGAGPTVALTFGVSLLTIAWAATGGPWLGAALLPRATRARPSTWPTRAFAWAAPVAVLAGGGWVGGRLVDVLTSKSQILKCRYTPHWDTLTVDKPSLGALLGGEVATRLAFDLEVHNPNRLPVRIEDNRVEIADGDGLVLARGRLTPFEAPAGATVRFRLGLEARLDAKSVLAGASLNPARWRVTLFLELDEGFEFPIFLAGGG